MRRDFPALLGGVILPLAFAPYGYAFVAILAFVLLFDSWHGASCAEAFRRGYWFGLGQFGLGFYWIFISLHDFGGVHTAVASLLTALLVAFLALYPGLAGLLSVRLGTRSGAIARLLLVFPATWVLVEWLRSWFLSGLPWLLVGYTQTDTLLRGFAPIAGTFGVGFATTVLAGLLLSAVRTHGWQRRGALLGTLVLLGAGAVLCRIEWTQASAPPFRSAVLQGNVAQDRKWLPEAQREAIDLYTRLTREHGSARLIVWPETAIPAFYQTVEREFVPMLMSEYVEQGHDLLLGIPYYDRRADRYFNALVALAQDPGVYFKRHLVPFGEYLPLRWILGFMLDVLNIPLSDFAAGEGEQSLLRAAGHPLAATVCYEDIFGNEARAGLPEAAYLVNVTNDAWFGDSSAPHQHWQMARMRAIEAGRYMVRATNSGVSGIIGPDGKVVAAAPLFQTVAVEGDVTPMRGATPYVLFGDAPIIAALAISVVIKLWRERRRTSGRGSVGMGHPHSASGSVHERKRDHQGDC